MWPFNKKKENTVVEPLATSIPQKSVYISLNVEVDLYQQDVAITFNDGSTKVFCIRERLVPCWPDVFIRPLHELRNEVANSFTNQGVYKFFSDEKTPSLVSLRDARDITFHEPILVDHGLAATSIKYWDDSLPEENWLPDFWHSMEKH